LIRWYLRRRPEGPAFELTVNGTGLVSGAIVNWNRTALTTLVSNSQVTAAVPAANMASAGTLITVTNPAPGGGRSNTEYFQMTNPKMGLGFQDTTANIGRHNVKPAMGDFALMAMGSSTWHWRETLG